MKKIITLIYFLAVSFTCSSQSDFDKALTSISADISTKLQTLNKKRVVVLYITDIEKQMTNAGKYMADVVSVNLVNNPGVFSVFDRSNLDEIAEAKKLYAEGYIDKDKAQQLGKILNVDVMIVGSYTQLSNTIKLTLKALDADNGLIIAASMKDLPLNDDAGALLGITIVSNGTNGVNSSANPSRASGEVTGRTSKNPDCKTKNIGDYSFQNNTQYKLSINFNHTEYSGMVTFNQTITIDPGQKQFFYDLPVGVYKYSIREISTVNTAPTYYQNSAQPGSRKEYYSEGNVYVEVCQAKEFVIK